MFIFGLVRITGRKREVGGREEGGDDGGIVGIFVAIGKLCVESDNSRQLPL